MKEDNLSYLSLEELISKKKKLQPILVVFTIIMFFGSIASLFLAIKYKDYAKLSLIGIYPLALLPGYLKMKKVNKEIKSRNTN
jgi:hypothetical protein